MTLEIPTGKVPGTVVRMTPAARPPIVGAMILGLLVCMGLFLYCIAGALYQNAIADPKHVDAAGNPDPIPDANNAGGHDPRIPEMTVSIYFRDIRFFTSEQAIVSFWIGCTFFCMSYMVFLYQRFYKDHVTIAKKRFRKWEDEGVQLHD